MIENTKLVETIEGIVREKLTSGTIVAINVDRGEDADGDEVIFIQVVFDGKSRLDASETVALTRHIRVKLIDTLEYRFPHLSFISKRDAEKLAAA